jgi:hypothetical protein
MFDHAVKLYAYLAEHAEDGVYKGTKTEAWREVGVSQTYYSSLWSAMEEMGSIEPLYVGGRGRRVHLRLLKPPDTENFSEAWRMRDLTKQASLATLQADVDAIKRQLPGIDIGSAIANHAARLEKLEQALDNQTGG